MKRALAGLGATLVLAGCATQPAPATAPASAPPLAAGQAVVLKNPGFEAEPGAGRPCPIQWDCLMHADPTSFRFATDEKTAAAGRRSARVERVKNEPWALLTQTLREPRLRGAKLRLTLAVRVEGASGGGAGPFFVAQGTSGRVLAHGTQLVTGTRDWHQVSVEFVLPPETEQLVVGATLEGPGTAWLDEARLDVLHPGK